MNRKLLSPLFLGFVALILLLPTWSMEKDKIRFFGAVPAIIPSYTKFSKKPKRKKQANPILAPGKTPIVYHDSYNVGFPGSSYLHSFDGCKYGKVYQYLVKQGLKPEQTFKPEAVTDADLRLVHSDAYLRSLESPAVVERIVEVPGISWVPNFLVQRILLNPMKLATGGTVLGAQLALKQGRAINLSGGYHHAKECSGGGFCAFADIPIAIKKMWQKKPTLKVMIVDLDAHQGNGHADALKKEVAGENARVAIFDIYNEQIFPRDHAAKEYITFNHPVSTGINTQEYLALLKRELPKAVAKFKPEMIIYNAGTDILAGDPLGRMQVSQAGVVERDKFVFDTAKKNSLPILMVLSGGYAPDSHKAISESVGGLLAAERVASGCGHNHEMQ
jgi:histone deacetylase 11